MRAVGEIYLGSVMMAATDHKPPTANPTEQLLPASTTATYQCCDKQYLLILLHFKISIIHITYDPEMMGQPLEMRIGILLSVDSVGDARLISQLVSTAIHCTRAQG